MIDGVIHDTHDPRREQSWLIEPDRGQDLKPGQFQKDAKTRLQEFLQGRKKRLPHYELLETSGAAHEQSFTVACSIEQPPLRTTGTGNSRRVAEQNAAQAALAILEA